jgi:hypothetical protein
VQSVASSDPRAIAELMSRATGFSRCAGRAGWDVTVVLLAYQRMANMDYLARAALAAGGVQRVVVSNNNPAHRIRDWVDVDDSRLTLIEQTVPKRCHERYLIARESAGRLFVFIDDDVLLTPEQITSLIERAHEAPEVAHGVHGSVVSWVDDATPLRELHYIGCEMAVDVIHTVYAFDRRLLEGYFANREHLLSTGEPDHGVCDDICLSYAGRSQPRVHDVGPYLVDPSWNADEVAVFKQPDYRHARTRVLEHFFELDLECRVPARHQCPP